MNKCVVCKKPTLCVIADVEAKYVCNRCWFKITAQVIGLFSGKIEGGCSEEG
jgi:hypothetical protein